jgi:hypothetical protein
MGWHAILQKNVPFCGSHATLCQNSEKCSTKQKGRQGAEPYRLFYLKKGMVLPKALGLFSPFFENKAGISAAKAKGIGHGIGAIYFF